MDEFKIKFNKFILYLKSRTHLVFFLISILSFAIILFNIIDLNNALGLSEFFVLNLIFQLLVIFSTIYAILLLPTYPAFYIIGRRLHFNFLEKLNLTIVINLSFYILTAYIGFFLGFPITALFFFLTLLIFYLSLVSYIIVQEYRNNKYRFIKAKKVNTINLEKFSLLKYVKSVMSTNGFLLIIFLLLICVLNVVRFTYFFGTDPWLHIFIIKSIVRMRYLPLEEYYGSIGLPIFGAVIHFFSGVDIILIPKWFVFYTILVSALVFYNILMKIFNNQALAIFGVFIIEFAGLGFAYMMYQCFKIF